MHVHPRNVQRFKREHVSWSCLNNRCYLLRGLTRATRLLNVHIVQEASGGIRSRGRAGTRWGRRQAGAQWRKQAVSYFFSLFCLHVRRRVSVLIFLGFFLLAINKPLNLATCLNSRFKILGSCLNNVKNEYYLNVAFSTFFLN